jgi:SRSO17 transposase
MMARGRGNDNNHNDSILGLVYAHGFIDHSQGAVAPGASRVPENPVSGRAHLILVGVN